MSEVDLTQRPPRSARARLGEFVLLPRILDKCRASLAARNGEYNFNCPLDQQFFSFAQVDAEAFRAEVKLGRGDGEMLDWVHLHSKRKPGVYEIVSWSRYQESRVPGDVEMREFFHGLHQQVAPARKDIVTWFDLLDLDDYVSYGGKP